MRGRSGGRVAPLGGRGRGGGWGGGAGGAPRGVGAGAGDEVAPRVGLGEYGGRGRQVFFEEDRGDEQGGGVVVEPASAAAVGGERLGWPGVHAEQVADGVVVLPAGQALDDAGAGVAHPFDGVEDGLNRGR